jgi:hypothetical protein
MKFYVDPNDTYEPLFKNAPAAPEPAKPAPAAPTAAAPAQPAQPATSKSKFYVDPDDDYKPLFKKGSFIPEASKGVAAGAVGTTASAVKGMAGLNEQFRRAGPEFMQSAIKVFDDIDSGNESFDHVGMDTQLMETAQAYRDMTPEQRAEFKQGMQSNLGKAEEISPLRDIRESGIYRSANACRTGATSSSRRPGTTRTAGPARSLKGWARWLRPSPPMS